MRLGVDVNHFHIGKLGSRELGNFQMGNFSESRV